MSVKLYGMGMSTCTRRSLYTLEEKNVPYELITTDLMKGEHKAPVFLEKQPFGQIPVLEDGDVRIFESRAIARYIATKWAAQGTDLLGKDPKEKALADTWMEVESSHFNPAASTLVYEKMFKAFFNAGDPDEAVIAAQLEKLNKVLAIYEAHLATQPYLAGQNYSLADLSHLSYGTYLFKSGISWTDNYPNVKIWWDKISSRPASVKVSAM